MKVVFVEFSPSGGLFQFTYQLGDGLARQGHDVELITGPRPELVSSRPGFAVKSVLPTWHAGSAKVDSLAWHRSRRGMRAAQHVGALVRVLLYVVVKRPDVFFWHALRFPIDCWAVVLASKFSPSVMAVVLHEPKPLSEQRGRRHDQYKSGRLTHSSLDAAMRRMDAVFVLSESVRDYVREKWNPPGIVEVIPHGDEAVFLPDGEVTKVEATPPDVLFFGTWTQYKGIDLLLAAFERVRKRVPEARLTMAGAVGNVDFDEVRRRAQEIGNVTLRPGYVPMPEVAQLMSAHRVIALPYERANQSGVALLGQTFGRAAVATRVGDIPEVVIHGRTGLIVEPGDEVAFADALTCLLESPEEAARMGAEAGRNVQSTGSWERIAETVSTSLKGME